MTEKFNASKPLIIMSPTQAKFTPAANVLSTQDAMIYTTVLAIPLVGLGWLNIL